MLVAGRRLHGVALHADPGAGATSSPSGRRSSGFGSSVFAPFPRCRARADWKSSLTSLGDRGLAQLAENPALAHVEELTIGDLTVGAPGLQALARSPHIGKLHTLVVRRYRLDSRCLDALAQLARRVGHLDLRGARLEGDPRRLFAGRLAILGIDDLDEKQSRRLVKEAPTTLGRVMGKPNAIIQTRWGRGWERFAD